MIRRLEIENFYSIRERQVIELSIGRSVPEEEGRFGAMRGGDRTRLPKAVAFFGANASGKSNVMRALAFLRWFLVESIDLHPDAPLPVERFADGNTEPARIKVFFEWSDELDTSLPQRGGAFAQYSYEVVIGPLSGRSNAVLSEEFRLSPGVGRSRRIFVRNESGSVEAGVGYSLKGISQFLVKLRPNVSLISMIAQFTPKAPMGGLLDWAKSIASNITPGRHQPDEKAATRAYDENSLMRSLLQTVIGQLDFGIQGIRFSDAPEGKKPEFIHYGLSTPLPIEGESDGTRQFYCVLPTIWHALNIDRGGIAVVDEIDSTIHPAILPAIMRWFYAPTNMTNAQLWFSGHSAPLLEELRKEEIFFTEKGGQGKTAIYGLKDIEGVRRVDNFYQKYLGGVYGAVPRIG